jgi:hypothetical protein
MRTLQLGILATLVLGVATLMGCESTFPMGPSLVDATRGDALADNIARMTANPNAGEQDTEPKIDPENAAAVLHKYYESQAKEQRQQELPSIIQIDAN